MKKDDFKERLQAERTKLEREMGGVGRKSPTVPDDWESKPDEIGAEADLVDQAEVIVNRENNAAVLADLEARYDATLAALDRIEKGTYGTCEVCGKEIEAARLQANPAATTCAEHMN